jgi:hypothetical protein
LSFAVQSQKPIFNRSNFNITFRPLYSTTYIKFTLKWGGGFEVAITNCIKEFIVNEELLERKVAAPV